MYVCRCCFTLLFCFGCCVMFVCMLFVCVCVFFFCGFFVLSQRPIQRRRACEEEI